MIDALVLCVRTPLFIGEDGVQRERYASVNAVSDHGATHGKKSPAYLALFRAVREAARAEMARTGWTTWPHGCEGTIVRYHRTRRMSDSPNIGKAECDSLCPSTPHEERRDRCAPFPGVYLDDKQVHPWHTDVEYDPTGPDRVFIVVRRRFPEAVDVAPRHRVKPRTTAAARPATQDEQRGASRTVLVDGVPTPIAEILARMGGARQSRRL